ncbi:hypothetical protein B0T20DRAFT_345266 [Sordaria brevicollis]|uniref:Uncharacterized protein n=1 Tax=Sordaria brevicollis TaxID=83679 RepID=A0AAE0UFB4_SORBR|nr:hypothetical protein B0T20DRAFT_345266 [Sordaria brevicollis]
MADIQDSDLIKAQLAMDALGAARATRSKTQAPAKEPLAKEPLAKETPPKEPPAKAPSAKETTAKEPPAIDLTSEALDMTAYKVWKDVDTGELLLTCGALLPPGYEKFNHPDLPWICPIRNCRVLLPGLMGLGRHFGMSHRACRLNDNLDGTLTDLGRYADPTHGDGRKFSGTTKPCIIVSKKYMSLEQSPMVEPKPYVKKKPAQEVSKPVQEAPKRELRRRSQIDGPGSIQVSVIGDDEGKNGSGPSEKILTKAKSGRPYAMWPDGSGTLKDLLGLLLPDEWTLYTEHPTHQWVCPVRSCRCLYSAKSHLANHFKMRYYGCRLNDNLDGTFTIVHRPPSIPLDQLRIEYHKNPPAVISRRRMDSEPLAEPQISQNFINRKLREHRRGKSSSASSSFPESIGKESKAATSSTSTENGPVISSDAGFDNDADGRPYTHWLNPQNNRFQVTRGLIPEGYELEHQAYPDRPWICPIRSCRFLNKTQTAYSNHWTLRHPNVCVNDNQDGTFSIVEGYSKSGPRVVSRRLMGYDESPLGEAQLPVKEREQAEAVGPSASVSPDNVSQQQKKAPPQLKRSFSETLEAEELFGDGDPDGLRRYITAQIGGQFPEVDETELELLLSLPRRRNLKLKHPIPVTHTLTVKQLAAVVAQLVGRESPNPLKLNRLVSSSYRNACANCLYDHTYNACSIKKPKLQEGLAAGTPTGITGGVGGDEARVEEAADEAGHDVEDEAEEEEEAYEYDERLGATVIRRSQRLPSLPAAEESVGEIDGIIPPRKAITFEDPSPDTFSGRLNTAEDGQEQEQEEYRRASKRLRTREQSALSTSIQATAAAARSLLVSQEDLVTETWERGSRGVLPNQRQPSENLVYASSYLTANQTVQIGRSTTFTSLTIPSGNTHQLPTDRSRTQSCSLLSGKLRVTLNDGENEFVVGPRGMFTVSPGTTCVLENRNYMDATVHVTAVADR